jgi:hypothetical protein
MAVELRFKACFVELCSLHALPAVVPDFTPVEFCSGQTSFITATELIFPVSFPAGSSRERNLGCFLFHFKGCIGMMAWYNCSMSGVMQRLSGILIPIQVTSKSLSPGIITPESSI